MPPGGNHRHIYLIGFSGSGKSAVGKELAERLGRRFVDIDRLIERRTKCSISRLFLDKGERAFRDLESRQIAEVARQKRPLVVALGGGAFERLCNRRVVGRSGVSIYLQCSVAELLRRLAGNDDRPLLQVQQKGHESAAQARKQRITLLLAKRRRKYLSATMMISTTGKTVSAVARQIQFRLRGWHESD